MNQGDKNEKLLAMFCHLGAFCGFIIPLGNIIAPLIIWLVKKDEFPLVDDQGKESLNFQISVLIYSIVAGFLVFFFIGIPLLVVIALFCIIQVIKASISANNGEKYRYPLCIRLIK